MAMDSVHISRSSGLRFLVLGILISAALVPGSGCSRPVAKLDRADENDASMRQARSRVEGGNADEAVKAYRKVLEETPGIARAHLDLALLLQDEKKDYIGAIYHYQRYLELRQGTQKQGMIEDRIRLAKQSLIATLAPLRGPAAPDDVALLKRENVALKDENQRLRQDVEALRGRGSEKMPPVSVHSPAGARSHTVAAGDKLSQIAATYGVKMPDIVKANGLKDVNSIRVGQVLVIPAPASTGDAGSP